MQYEMNIDIHRPKFNNRNVGWVSATTCWQHPIWASLVDGCRESDISPAHGF